MKRIRNQIRIIHKKKLILLRMGNKIIRINSQAKLNNSKQCNQKLHQILKEVKAPNH